MTGHILLTGFDPFGGEARNPSIELAQALHGETLHGLHVVAEPLPCEFARAPAVLEAALARWTPRMVVALGQAAGRCELSLERVAINLIDARIPDNAGLQPIDTPVSPDGPAAYFTSLPIKRMVDAVRAVGVPASVSHSAGTFVCNQVFYALQHVSTKDAAVDAAGHRLLLCSGFMHLPLLPEQASRHPGQPSMPLATMVTGLRATLGAAVEAMQARQGDARHSEGSLH